MKKAITLLAISIIFAVTCAHATVTAEQPTTESGTPKKWGVTIGYILPVPEKFDVEPNKNVGLSIIAKQSIRTGFWNLTIPIEIEASIFKIYGKHEHALDRRDSPTTTKIYTEHEESFLDLTNNVLARFSPLSTFYVEGGLKWGFTIIHNPSFTFGIPVGLGFTTDMFEIGARVTFGLTDYTSTFGSVTLFQPIIFSIIF